jgi:hypothetical protein
MESDGREIVKENWPKYWPKGTTKYPKVAGVYVINGPNGVYVGQSTDCWSRGTLHLAVLLGLDCGVIREEPIDWKRLKAERDVMQVFKLKGMNVVSQPSYGCAYGGSRRPPTKRGS